jgi:hypothetical protein
MIYLLLMFKGQNQSPFHDGHCCCSSAYETNRRNFYFAVSITLRHNPSASCVIVVNDIRKFLDIFSKKKKKTVRFEDKKKCVA